MAIDQPDQPGFLGRSDEFAARDQSPVFVAHSQQAFEIIRFARSGADHRLKCEEQAILAECCADGLLDRDIAPKSV